MSELEHVGNFARVAMAAVAASSGREDFEALVSEAGRDAEHERRLDRARAELSTLPSHELIAAAEKLGFRAGPLRTALIEVIAKNRVAEEMIVEACR